MSSLFHAGLFRKLDYSSILDFLNVVTIFTGISPDSNLLKIKNKWYLVDGCTLLAPPGTVKSMPSPPGQIPEYAPGYGAARYIEIK